MSGHRALDDPLNNGVPQTTRRIFISYAREDAALVEDLRRGLLAHGLEVWDDVHEIALGDSILSSIDDALRNADAIVIVLSRSTQRSTWVSSEVAAAVATRVANPETIIIPLLLDRRADIPPLLQDTQGLALWDGADLEGVANAIAMRVKYGTAGPRDISSAIEAANLQAASLRLQTEVYIADITRRTEEAVGKMWRIGSLLALTVLLLSFLVAVIGYFVNSDFHGDKVALVVISLTSNGVLVVYEVSNRLRRRKGSRT